MNPSASALSFKSLRFIRVSVETDFNCTASSKDFDFHGVNVGFSVKHTKLTNGTWVVMLGFLSTNQNAEVLCPYKIDILAFGTFTVAPNYPEEKAEKLVYENGSALIYGSIRDLVATITARGNEGALMLPTPTFVGEYEKYLSEKEAEESANQNVNVSKKSKKIVRKSEK